MGKNYGKLFSAVCLATLAAGTISSGCYALDSSEIITQTAGITLTPGAFTDATNNVQLQTDAVAGSLNTIQWRSFNVPSNQTADFNFQAAGQTFLNYVPANGNMSTIAGQINVTGSSGAHLLIINPNGIVMNGGNIVSTAANSNLLLSTDSYYGPDGPNTLKLRAYTFNKKFGYCYEDAANGLVINNSNISGFNNVSTLSQGTRITGNSTISADNSFTSLVAGDAYYNYDTDTFSNIGRTKVAPFNVHYSDVLQPIDGPNYAKGYYNTDDQFVLENGSKVHILTGHDIDIELLSQANCYGDDGRGGQTNRDVAINISGQLIADNCIADNGQVYIYASARGSSDYTGGNADYTDESHYSDGIHRSYPTHDAKSLAVININNPTNPDDPTTTVPAIVTYNETPAPFQVVKIEADKITSLTKDDSQARPNKCSEEHPFNPPTPLQGAGTIQLVDEDNTQANLITHKQTQTNPIGVPLVANNYSRDQFTPEVDVSFVPPLPQTLTDQVKIQWVPCPTPPPPPPVPGGGGGFPAVAVAAPVGLAALATPFLFPPPIFPAAPVTGAAAPVMCPDMQAIPVYDESGNIKYLRIVKKA